MGVASRLAGEIEGRPGLVLSTVLAAALALDTSRLVAAGQPWALSLGADVVLCAAAVLRRRNLERAAAIAIAAFALATLTPELLGTNAGPVEASRWLALLLVAASAMRRLPARRAAVLAAVGGALVVAGQSSHGTGAFKPAALDALAAATLWAGALGIGLWLRHLDGRRARLLEEVRRDERLGLARELHDLVAHHVTGIVVQAQAARFAGSDDPELLGRALLGIEDAGGDTLDALRRLVGLLRDPEDAAGVLPAPEPLDRLVERFGRRGTAVELHLPADCGPRSWPPEIGTTVYRIVQEALTNVARHAPAARLVTVSVAHDPGCLRIEIRNDVPGAAPRAVGAGGYGLVGMRERVEALGGELRCGPGAASGWEIRASLPLPCGS